MTITPAEIERVKKAARVHLEYLCTKLLWMNQAQKSWAPCHTDLANFLKRPTKRKLVLFPRNHLKSSVITKGWSIQQALVNPDIRILIASDTWDNASKFLRSIEKFLIQSPLNVFFGNFVSDHWTQDEATIRQRKQILDAPTWATTGIEKEQTSQHYDLIILDDLVARDNCGSKELRDKVKQYYRDSLDWLEPGGQIVVVGTRWHQDDLYSLLLEPGSGFDVLHRQAYTDESRTAVIFPEKFSLEYLEQLRKPITQGGKGAYEFACTPGETPILMADWKTKPIEHVKVGDELIGFTLGSAEERSKLVKTRVKRVFSKPDHVLRLKMKSGRTVLCTKDHKWHTGRNDETHRPYAPAHPGSRLSYVCPVEPVVLSEREKQDWNYLAGLFDGEGSTKSGGALTLTQCSEANPEVHRSIGSVLTRLGISYGTFIRLQTSASPGRNHSKGNTSFWMHDSFNVGLGLIRETPCGKAGQIASRFLRKGKRWVREEDEVEGIEYDSYRTVHALETETGNYVAWGYASSNSQYLNNPIDSEAADFKVDWIKYYAPGTPHPASLYLTVDPAISLSRDADYTAMLVAGQFEDKRIRVVDYLHERLVPSELVDRVFTLVEKWKLHRVGIETFAFQKTLKYEIQRQQRERNIFFSIDELGKSHAGRGEPALSKEARIRRLQPYFEQGLVEIRSDMSSLVDELLAFPRGKHDDLIDALAYQLDYIRPIAGSAPVKIVKEGTMGDLIRRIENRLVGTAYQEFMKDLREAV